MFTSSRAMQNNAMALRLSAALTVLVLVCPQAAQNPPAAAPAQNEPRFKTSVDVVNIAVTVTDDAGHLVTGLTKDDFQVYDNDVLQTVTHFGINPISLGIVLDASGSMDGERIRAARTALDRLLDELRDPNNEFFLYQFNSVPLLLQRWTSEKRDISRALTRVKPDGGTALYDAMAPAVQLAVTGSNSRRAVLLVSDGNDDGSSRLLEREVQQLVRENEVAIYAIGIDGPNDSKTTSRPPPPRPMPPMPRFPFPGQPRRPGLLRQLQWPLPQSAQGGQGRRMPGSDSVNVRTLRALTDDSGGRTEIVRTSRDLEPATANIARELSQQYYLGYVAPEKDGRVHTIRVEVPKARYIVRARRSYVAS